MTVPEAAARLPSFAIVALLAACGSGNETASPSHPPSEEGVVNIYNWANYLGPNAIAAFEARTGDRVVYDTYDSEETLETKLLEGESGYDVVAASSDTFGAGIMAGIFTPIDRRLLPNWRHLDARALAVIARFDEGNRYAVPYLHGINGFAYNVDLVRARMPDAPVDSLDLIFNPAIVARFADCGVSFLDSPVDVLQLALVYLHRDPNSARPEDYQAAQALLLAVRPSIRNFESSGYIQDLANGELCIAMSWSSDYSVAMARAKAAGVDLHLAFSIPREGANITYDALLIPAGAPHPKAAHRFLNYMLDPRAIADVTNSIHYGNNNSAANAFVDPRILKDPALYPPPEVEERLYFSLPPTPEMRRLRTRSWTKIKTGR